MSKILVTGGAGFIGSHLVDELIKKGHRVTVVDNLSTGKKSFVNSQAVFYKQDVTLASLAKVFKKARPDLVFHLAAQKSVGFSVSHPAEDARINIGGSLNVIDNCLAAGVKKFIFISTGGAIYGEARQIPTPETTAEKPDSPYGLSKLAIDNYLEKFYNRVKKLNYVSLRLANVYGPRQDPFGEAGVIAVFASNLLKKKPCHINGSGRQTRDFVYVSDVVSACLKAAGRGRGAYNIATAREISINALYQKLADIFKARSAKHYPALPGEVFRSSLNYQKAKKVLGWQPKVTLEQGIEQTIEYFRGCGPARHNNESVG